MDAHEANKILIVDDESSQRMLLRFNLEKNYEVFEAENGAQALNILDEHPEIRKVVTDLWMPVIDGFTLIEEIRSKEIRYTYIIVLSANNEDDATLKALSNGADDFLAKPVHPEELHLRLQSGSRLLRLESHEELILSMAKLADYRSAETGYHLERIGHYADLIATDLVKKAPETGLTSNIASEIVKVSPLHDIGKVAIPDNILHKPGKLTVEEFEVIKTHTTIGGKLIKEIFDKTNSLYLQIAYEIIMHHHERWDGTGYPTGLAGNDIPIGARIVTLADVYDAMTSKRCYKDAISHDEVKAFILNENGKMFDPLLIDVFLRNEKEWITIKERFKDQ